MCFDRSLHLLLCPRWWSVHAWGLIPYHAKWGRWDVGRREQLRTAYRYQETGEQLQLSNFKLFEELETQKSTLSDVHEFLTKALEERSAANAALEAQVAEVTARLEEAQLQHQVCL